MPGGVSCSEEGYLISLLELDYTAYISDFRCLFIVVLLVLLVSVVCYFSFLCGKGKIRGGRNCLIFSRKRFTTHKFHRRIIDKKRNDICNLACLPH